MSIQRNLVLCPQTSILCSCSYCSGKVGEYAGLQGEVTAFVGMPFSDTHDMALLISSPHPPLLVSLVMIPIYSCIEVTSVHQDVAYHRVSPMMILLSLYLHCRSPFLSPIWWTPIHPSKPPADLVPKEVFPSTVFWKKKIEFDCLRWSIHTPILSHSSPLPVVLHYFICYSPDLSETFQPPLQAEIITVISMPLYLLLYLSFSMRNLWSIYFFQL